MALRVGLVGRVKLVFAELVKVGEGAVETFKRFAPAVRSSQRYRGLQTPRVFTMPITPRSVSILPLP